MGCVNTLSQNNFKVSNQQGGFPTVMTAAYHGHTWV
jgi:hypothetical protein